MLDLLVIRVFEIIFIKRMVTLKIQVILSSIIQENQENS
jgi:hypothetical protein